jgi:hypothetical protein
MFIFLKVLQRLAKPLVATSVVFFALVSHVQSQPIRGGGNPYSSQLITDPDAGTVQGIQRYGKPLPADPEQGSGYPYFVFPSVRDTSRASPFNGSPTLRLDPYQQRQVRQQFQQLEAIRKQLEPPSKPGAQSTTPNGNQELPTPNKERSQAATELGESSKPLPGTPVPVHLPIDIAKSNVILAAPASPVFIPLRGADPDPAMTNASIPHQPLIQIKLRVVEIIRDNDLAVASTLDYIRNRRGIASPFKGFNVNNDQQNLTGASRFAVPNLIDIPGNATVITDTVPTGAGALINLTSEHLNWIARLLAEELHADILTAPELVTTNGQRVEFIAGEKDPFTLGTVQSNGEAAVQNNLFYKHVGTYISVQPRIINFGPYGAGGGDAPIVESDVRDWNLVIRFVVNEGFAGAADLKKIGVTTDQKAFEDELTPYTLAGRLVPLEMKTKVLGLINQFSRTDLRRYVLEHESDPGFEFRFYDMIADCSENGCDWHPENCTIDLEVLARFSNKDTDVPKQGFTAVKMSNLNAESDVRAIANIVQIKSGTGLVMAGLLGESDIESVAKIPVLGDLPAVGALFRSKNVSRRKTEILIFIEARIMSSDSSIARAESAEDLCLAAPYVAGGTLDNPLEVGLRRAGLGPYLPPPDCNEVEFWNQCGWRVNKIKTTAYDAFR